MVMVNNLSGMYVLGTLIFALFARGEVQPFNSVSFNQGDIMLNILAPRNLVCSMKSAIDCTKNIFYNFYKPA